jgi:hypothetical protein
MAKASGAAPMPLSAEQGLVAPTALSCLQCKVFGRRQLLCSSAVECKAAPRVCAFGPFLLLGWLAMMAAFFFAVM